MNTIRKILLIEMGASLSIVLAIVLLYECGILAMGNSMIDGQTMFLVMVIMQLITIACIPLALYLFRISKVQRPRQ